MFELISTINIKFIQFWQILRLGVFCGKLENTERVIQTGKLKCFDDVMIACGFAKRIIHSKSFTL